MTTSSETPLVILQVKNYDARGNKLRALAAQWASQNPDAEGYIVFTDDPPGLGIWTGGAFYRILNGKAYASSAVECQPEEFAQQAQRVREQRAERKRTLRHPLCSY